MSASSSGVSRRAMLARLVAGPAAVTFVGLGMPTNILAANDAQAAKTLLPFFVSGMLVEADQDHIVVQTPGYDPGSVIVNLTVQTQICRGSCTAAWNDLKLGDRIDSCTYAGSDGVRAARWVNANMVAGWGTIKAINGAVLTIASDKPTVPDRALTIYPYTTVAAGEIITTGRGDALRIGDYVQFTATADDPNPFVVPLMGMLVCRIETYA